jgi:hypothetical protein
MLLFVVLVVVAFVFFPMLQRRARISAYARKPISYDLRLQDEVVSQILKLDMSITVKPLREFSSNAPQPHSGAAVPDKGVLMVRLPQAKASDLPQINKKLLEIHRQAAMQGYQGRFVLTLEDKPVRTIP